MNNKVINEFGFRRIWRIKQIAEGINLLDLFNSSYPTQPHSLIAKYVNRMKKFKYGEVVGTMKNNLNKVNRIAASEAQ